MQFDSPVFPFKLKVALFYLLGLGGGGTGCMLKIDCFCVSGSVITFFSDREDTIKVIHIRHECLIIEEHVLSLPADISAYQQCSPGLLPYLWMCFKS